MAAAAAVIPVPTQYIFMLWWYQNHNHAIPANQMQDVPPGGWNHWTARHNVSWLLRGIHGRAKFVLLGNLNALRGQAMNAGTGINQCVIGMEVLLLLSAGYTFRAPNVGVPDETAFGGGVRVFDPPAMTRDPDLNLIDDAETKNLRLSAPVGFWTPQLHLQYNTALQ